MTSSDYITITMIVAYIYIYMLLVTIGSYHYYSYSTIYMSYIYINNVPVIYRNYWQVFEGKSVWPRSGPGGTSTVGLGPEGDPGRFATIGFFTKG